MKCYRLCFCTVLSIVYFFRYNMHCFRPGLVLVYAFRVPVLLSVSPSAGGDCRARFVCNDSHLAPPSPRCRDRRRPAARRPTAVKTSPSSVIARPTSRDWRVPRGCCGALNMSPVGERGAPAADGAATAPSTRRERDARRPHRLQPPPEKPDDTAFIDMYICTVCTV